MAEWINTSPPSEDGADIEVRRSPASGFNLNSFMSDIRTRGIIKSNSFMVSITPPKLLKAQWSDARRIIIRCDSASLPSVNWQMNEHHRHGYGPQESSPHNVQFEPTNLTFILDAQGEIYNFWQSWMNAIMNFDRSQGLNGKDTWGKQPYEHAYKDDYSADLKVLVYDEAANAAVQVTMLKAFPMGISEVNFNWSGGDDVTHLNIPISYRDYFTQTAKVTDLSSTLRTFFDFSSNANLSPSIQASYPILGTPTARSSILDSILADINLL